MAYAGAQPAKGMNAFVAQNQNRVRGWYWWIFWMGGNGVKSMVGGKMIGIGEILGDNDLGMRGQ